MPFDNLDNAILDDSLASAPMEDVESNARDRTAQLSKRWGFDPMTRTIAHRPTGDCETCSEWMMHYLNASETDDRSFAIAIERCDVYWENIAVRRLGPSYMGPVAADDYGDLKKRLERYREKTREMEKTISRLEAELAVESSKSRATSSLDVDDDRRRKKPRAHEARPENISLNYGNDKPVKGTSRHHGPPEKLVALWRYQTAAPEDLDENGGSDVSISMMEPDSNKMWALVELNDGSTWKVRYTAFTWVDNSAEDKLVLVDSTCLGEWDEEVDRLAGQRKRSEEERSRRLQPVARSQAGALPYPRREKVKPTNLSQPKRGASAFQWINYWRVNEIKDLPRGVARDLSNGPVFATVEGHLEVSYRSPVRGSRRGPDFRRDWAEKSVALFRDGNYQKMIERGLVHTPLNVASYAAYNGELPLTFVNVAQHYSITGMTLAWANGNVRQWAQTYANSYGAAGEPSGINLVVETLDGVAPTLVADGMGMEVPAPSSSGQQNTISPLFVESLLSQPAGSSMLIDDPMVISYGPPVPAPVAASSSLSSSSFSPLPPSLPMSLISTSRSDLSSSSLLPVPPSANVVAACPLDGPASVTSTLGHSTLTSSSSESPSS